MKQHINQLLSESGIVLTPAEIDNLECADFGLKDFVSIGLIVHTYINTSRYCAKELILLPHQTCPEHRHPNRGAEPGKQETFRCRYGLVSLFVEGNPTLHCKITPPRNGEEYYSVFNEIVLKPGEQYTIMPNIKHWFQAHENGAVVSEFSSHSDDASDIFTDPRINRFSFLR
ncbi:D-lyxose/D-mannose family sugar isomerase [Thorsellia anophelis]|uniref:D-lyxose ketol-isomerase n=1 Tax=Thorsellia anophelis DSM 18579 TaxID=1123402 RepID=A0A1I0F689_9GAMM|nr:D-lyxose/D-mannose family sugar isomerase [Thorsellia anophelis]SET53563.1 D-lyxose ketol-isomerase [Thorsellia anophelis DSM 18579]